jgi:hypothetical protein
MTPEARKRYCYSLTITGEIQSNTEIGAKLNLHSLIQGAIGHTVYTSVDSLEVDIVEVGK